MRLETTDYREKRIKELKEEVKGFKRKPKLAIIVAKDFSNASAKYVKQKHKVFEMIGLDVVEYQVEWKGREKEFEIDVHQIIRLCNEVDSIDGIIVQLPVPFVDENKIASWVHPNKDVDGFNPINLGKLMRGEDCLVSCTPKGIMDYIDYLGIDLEGINATIVGRSNIVGKPLANLLINRGATVTSCNSRTKNLMTHTYYSQLVITAIGKPKYFTSCFFNQNATIIDVGINFDENGKMCGDVDYENVYNDSKKITPVPKGVGQLTTLALAENVIKAYKMNGGD